MKITENNYQLVEIAAIQVFSTVKFRKSKRTSIRF